MLEAMNSTVKANEIHVKVDSSGIVSMCERCWKMVGDYR